MAITLMVQLRGVLRKALSKEWPDGGKTIMLALLIIQFFV